MEVVLVLMAIGAIAHLFTGIGVSADRELERQYMNALIEETGVSEAIPPSPPDA